MTPIGLGRVLCLALWPVSTGSVANGNGQPGLERIRDVAHVHLSLSGSGNPVVSWSTVLPRRAPVGAKGASPTQAPSLDKPRVRHGPAAWALGDSANVTLASKSVVWRGRQWNVAEIGGLVAGTSYNYQCSFPEGRAPATQGSSGSAMDFGEQLQLRMPPSPGQPLRLAILGDLAVDGDSPEVLRRILQGPALDATLHLGDIAGNLTDEDHRRGDRFLEMVQPLSSSVPYLTLPGDRDDISAYNRFFQMPAVSPSGPWYSVALGPARIIFLWTSSLLTGGDKAQEQLSWLKSSLEAASTAEERQRRPWLIVAGHRPIYCSLQQPACGTEAQRLRVLLEPLFLRHRVDLYLSAHLHAYERTFAVAKDALCPGQHPSEAAVVAGSAAACAPVHIVNGAAGTPSLQYETVPAQWTAQRHPGVPGHGELTIFNGTHLQYRQLEAAGGASSDDFWLLKPHKTVEEKPNRKQQEENFLEAIFWLVFATGVVLGTCAFIRWSHGDGQKRRDEALTSLRVELAVLSGVPSKVLGALRESEQLVAGQEEGRPGAGLH